MVGVDELVHRPECSPNAPRPLEQPADANSAGHYRDAGRADAAFLGFNTAGTRLAVAGVGGELALIDVDPASWTRTACALAQRELTAAEWRDFAGNNQPRVTVCADRAGP